VKKSPEASRALRDLLDLPPEQRRDVYRTLKAAELRWVFTAAKQDLGSPYGLWQDDCRGFVEDVLGERGWSVSNQVMGEVSKPGARVVVPSCFSSGKTWSAARVVLWWVNVWPMGTQRAVVLAPLWRQVVNQLWPELRRTHARAGLPGVVDQSQMKMPTPEGIELQVAYGIAAAPHNEHAVQGIHSANLLLVIDEAGGLGHVIGRNVRGLLTGDNTRLLAIGNPPTDEERSWFERLSEEPTSTVIPISAFTTPNLTGEVTPRCGSCGDEVPPHPIARHLVDQQWVADTIRVHGEDSPFVQAKVHARFPRGLAATVIPARWVEQATIDHIPDPQPGDWVRLGVDVAADGGDEMVIARSVGPVARIVHTSAGEGNASSVTVAGIVLTHILEAEELARALGSEQVRVKIDGIGVGWGVAGLLVAWGNEGRHNAHIEVVVVSEAPDREPEHATLNPANKRAEMWLAGRALLMPDDEGEQRLQLAVDPRTAAQLFTPRITYNSSGKVVVEQKVKMKARGVPSPDRAEAVLLAIYEPGPKGKRRRVRILNPM
jgi:hypothetical protein